MRPSRSGPFLAGIAGGIAAVALLALLAAWLMPKLMPRVMPKMMARMMEGGEMPEAMRACMEKCGCGPKKD